MSISLNRGLSPIEIYRPSSFTDAAQHEAIRPLSHGSTCRLSPCPAADTSHRGPDAERTETLVSSGKVSG